VTLGLGIRKKKYFHGTLLLEPTQSHPLPEAMAINDLTQPNGSSSKYFLEGGDEDIIKLQYRHSDAERAV
jgi:hypothetical protein